jgi:hypothetical protein
MKNLYVFFALAFVSTNLLAQSCFPLYEQKANAIQKRDGYETHIGGQIYINQGQLDYWPGITVQASISNWSKELVEAIKWGPFFFTVSDEDPRKDWLEAFRKSIRRECKLPEKNYDHLRAMLKELMEDGSFCPGNKILKPKLIKGKSEFKKVLKNAISEGRFNEYCRRPNVVNESYRKIKDVQETKKKDQIKLSGKKQ